MEMLGRSCKETTRHRAQGTFLFLGDNFIVDFDWQKRMPFFQVHSYGVPREEVQGLLKRLQQIEERVATPDIILIMTGINNVIAEDYTFVDQIRRIVIRLSNTYPDAEIIVNSLPNIRISFLVDRAIYHLNADINKMTRQTGCCYLGNFAGLAEQDADIFEKDGIMLTPKTYDRWARSILEYVAFLVEEN
ncbi:hypothetical protein [Desulfopila inferna]|uniref:hypothetical protein n=1 Tax=Desulfopila inferna TaxID=468528 RepID=UPI0019654671|nr:hypothetical protein [Desulfopila inferna]MBM9606550.1 hypothetical protein [Desulfopila inferna]